MARIDQAIDEKELTHLNGLVATFQIPEKYQGQIFSHEMLKPKVVEEGFTLLAQKNLHYSFFLDLIVMAMADGVLMDAERKMLAQIQKLIHISAVEMHNLLTFAQSTMGLDPKLMIDPMYSYMIDNFFKWARQSQVKLFKQTAFSVNPAMDAYLKAQLRS